MFFRKLLLFLKRLWRKNMLLLIIEDSGYTLNIPGFNEVRTPVEISVQRRDLNVIVSYLRKVGISNFHIKSGNKDPKNIEQTKEEQPVKNVFINNEDPELKKKIENIENLLLSFLKDKKDPIYYNKENIELVKKKAKEILENDDIDFIPSIDISTMSTKGNLTQTTTKMDSEDNIQESANLLKSLKKKSLEKYHSK